MSHYSCEPITLWMLATLIPVALIPVALLYFGYLRGVYWWSERKYPRLIDDFNRRRLFEGAMLVGGLFVFVMAWGFLYEALCRV